MTIDRIRFDGRIAIVTGGGTGIGHSTALQLAARIRDATGSACIAVPTDVKDEGACIRLVERTIETFGGMDILVNNAGGTRMGPLESIPARGWDSIFELDMRSAYVCTREAGRHMIARKSGAIVNISSGAGITGVRGGAHYSAAKAALQMFTTVTAAEWGRHGIRCNCVAAGMIASERAVDAWNAAGLDARDMGSAIPLGRAGTPEDMANMIVFLASDAAAYVSGQTIAVNGGPALGGIALD